MQGKSGEEVEAEEDEPWKQVMRRNPKISNHKRYKG